MEDGLEANLEKTKYMLLSRHQTAGENHNRYLTNPLKMWHSSDISERQQRIKMSCRRKERGD
jgi:hypothetical protein